MTLALASDMIALQTAKEITKMEFLQTKNECNVWLVQDFDGEAVNPRYDDHHTEIFFHGTRNLRASGPDQIVDRETYDERLEDPEFYTMECSEVVGQRPGIALISINKETFKKEYGSTANPEKVLNSLVREYALWAEGEVYGYRVFNSRGELVDDCYGFIGEEYAKEAALEALEDVASNEPLPSGYPGKVFQVCTA